MLKTFNERKQEQNQRQDRTRQGQSRPAHQDPPLMNHAKYRQAHDPNCPLPSPTLYRLASERRYHELPIHVKANPQDIYWEDRYGSTALHVLCCSRQVGHPLTRAIDAIIERDPSLVAKPNEASWTPLHLACEKRLLWRTNEGTGHLVLKLVKACPQAVSLRLQTGYRAKTPFHIACETNALVEVLEAMLLADPSLALQEYKGGETPLEILWAAQLKDPHNTLQSSLQKMRILLQASFFGKMQQLDDVRDESKSLLPSPFWIVCAVCSIRCPRDYVTRILTLHRNEISIPNERTGLLPLHYAIQSSREEDNGMYTSFLIESLLEEYPDAAMVPFNPGRRLLPLHVLIDDRAKTWHKGGVASLVLASNADVLITPDPRTRLVPALASATHAIKSRQHLSTTFELLRLCPQVLQPGFFCEEKDDTVGSLTTDFSL